MFESNIDGRIEGKILFSVKHYSVVRSGTRVVERRRGKQVLEATKRTLRLVAQ